MKRNLSIHIVLLLAVFGIFTSYAQAQNINAFAGDHTYGYGGDGGLATNAQVNHPVGLAVDPLGNIYIADVGNRVIRKVNTTGIITTVAGSYAGGIKGDGIPATDAYLSNPMHIAIDAVGNLYIADNGSYTVRKISTAGVISTVAGNGTVVLDHYTGDGLVATTVALSFPTGMAVDNYGNIYFSDYANSAIRKVNASGIISTCAGTERKDGYSGDGGAATSATLRGPMGLATDAVGNLYIADRSNSVVRKVSTSGIITTVAGNGINGYSGDGGAATNAQLSTPMAINVDASGNIYIADFGNHTVRKVTTAGIISTVTGTGTSGFSGNGGPATAALFDHPYGVTTDASSNLYISDWVNNQVRVIKNSTVNTRQMEVIIKLGIYPNPARNVVYLDGLQGAATYRVMDAVGSVLLKGTLDAVNNSVAVSGLAKGIYVLETADAATGVRMVSKVVKE